MALRLNLPPSPPRLHLILRRVSTDEYIPLPYSAIDRRVIAQVRGRGPKIAAHLSMSLGDYWSSRYQPAY